MPAPTQGMGTLGVPDIVLAGKKISEDVSDAIVDVTINRTITGASTITLSIADPLRTLLRSGVFDYRLPLTLDGLDFVLVEIDKQQDLLELTFEDASVNALRRTNGVIVAAAGTTTRSEFAGRLVAQTKGVTLVAYPDPIKTREPLTRGTSSNALESTWAALTRLANEVQWRCFSDGNDIYFGPDDWLMQQPVVASLREMVDGGADNIDFNFDEGKPLTSITVTLPAALWVWAPGKPVQLEDMGIASGKFLTSTISRSLFVTTASVQLTAPQQALPEPIATTAQDGTVFISGGDTPEAGAPAKIVAAATSQIGTPYRLGAEDPGVSFDCSGLTQWCCAQASITIPRTSETQWAALPPANPVKPGDLVFFVGDLLPGESPPGHVGVYIGDNKFIDAPYTGALVRVDDVSSVGSYMGARRPW